MNESLSGDMIRGMLMSLDRACDLLAEGVEPLPARGLPLEEAAGLVLAASVHSDGPLPLTDLSAMDGYALRHGDLVAGRPLPITLEAPAGTAPGSLAEGCAARIFTGAPLPEGADTVVPQERATTDSQDRVSLEVLERGANVRFQGELFAEGQEIGRAGEEMTPPRLALLVAGGARRVEVHPRPRVATLVTGRELVGLDQRPRPGQIRNTNGAMFRALAQRAGLPLVASAQAGDTKEAIREGLTSCLAEAELVLTSGGVSVGDYDLVPGIIESLGGEILFHGLSIKPGKPALVARVGGSLIVGLPGNPLASLVVWRVIGWPLARRLAGDPEAFRETPVMARLEQPVNNPIRRTLLRMGRLSGCGQDARARVIEWKGSHDLVAGAGANVLLRIEPGQELAAGSSLSCYPL